MSDEARRIEDYSKRTYASPKLTEYGSVKTLTNGLAGSGADSSGFQPLREPEPL